MKTARTNLRRTEIKVVGVDEELGQVEELGNELLDVRHVVLGGTEPCILYAVEHPVGKIKVPSLKEINEWHSECDSK